jgi:DMSO reductase anchor subunit
MSEEPWSQGRARERMRSILASIVLGALVAAAAGVYTLALFGRSSEGTGFIQTVFPALAALTGSVIGFYFGSKQE